jgi:hypothetical protein
MIKPEYVELEFSMPFYEMYFSDTWNDGNLPKNPFELTELCDSMGIILDTDILYKEYEAAKYKEGDIYIFYLNNNKDIFIYFDLYKDQYDQMAMIVLGVRIKTVNKSIVKPILEKLYFKSTTRSDFQEDYFNQSFYRIAANKIPYQGRIVRHFINGKLV